MNAPRHSLQNRLLGLVLGVVLSVWLATACMTWFDVRHELDELLDGHLAQAAAILVVQQTADIDEDAPGADAPSLHRYAPKVAYQVFHEGRLALRSANAPATPLAGAGNRFRPGFETVQVAGTSWRVFCAYGAQSDVHVYVGEETESRGAILWAVLRATLLPMALALPLLALALWWSISHSIRPLRVFGRTLAQRAPDAVHLLALEGAPAEMAPMVNALNGLFERITTLLESERRFTADASHELRTPIAAIRAQAQVAMGETDAKLRRQALQSTLAGCDRAIHLVEQLLTLSRLDAAAAPVMSTLDMTALTRSVVATLAAQSVGKEQSLEFVGPQPCQVTGNEALLCVLLRNLVDNAVRYCPPGGSIRVSVQATGRHCALCVEDSGAGLSDSDLARLGERFFRVAGSGDDGSGLGWSIVKRIAQVHGMQLEALRSTGLGGLAIHMLLHQEHKGQ
jgi:two-component system sensor histidine kinase QseC